MAWNSSSATPASPRFTKAPTASRRWTWSAANCPSDNGRAVRAFFETVGGDIAEAKAAGDPAGVAAALEPALADLQAATMWLAQNGMADPNNAGAGAYAYQDLMGLVALRLDVAQDGRSAAKRALDEGRRRAFYETKLHLAEFYAKRELSGSTALRAKVEAGAETVMRMPEEAF